MKHEATCIRWFEEIKIEDVPLVGGKNACRRCFASPFIDRAISYRIDQGFDHFIESGKTYF